MASLAPAFKSIVSRHMSQFASVSGLPAASANSLQFNLFLFLLSFILHSRVFLCSFSVFAFVWALSALPPLFPALR